MFTWGMTKVTTDTTDNTDTTDRNDLPVAVGGVWIFLLNKWEYRNAKLIADQK